MVTIEPRALRSAFSAARANRNAAVRLVSMTRCHSAKREPAQRLADHDAGVGNKRRRAGRSGREGSDRTRRGLPARARRLRSSTTLRPAREKARRKPLSGRSTMPRRQPCGEQMTRNGAADAVGPSGHQRDRFRARHRERVLSLAALNRKVGPRAPFRPRAVVEPAAACRSSPAQARRIAAVTPDPHEVMIGLSRSTPAEVNASSMRSRDASAAVFQHALERHIERARHVARTQARTRLRRLAGKPLGRAGIDDLRALVGQRHAHVGEHGHGDRHSFRH